MGEHVFGPVVLYDGVCAFCNRGVLFLVKNDHHDRLRFASLQSDFAKALLGQHGVAASELDTIYVVMDYRQVNESLLARSDAVIQLARALGGIWNIASLLRLVPKRARDRMYDVIARHRHRVLGKHETCKAPEQRYRHKFLDQTLQTLRDGSALLV